MFVFIQHGIEQRGMYRPLSKVVIDRQDGGGGERNRKEGGPFRLDRLPFPKWSRDRKPIFAPAEAGPSNWSGSASVYFRQDTQEYIAVVRERQQDLKITPDGQENGRGASIKIYTSKTADFQESKLVSRITKDDLAGKETIDREPLGGIVSFERAALDFVDDKPVLYLSRAKEYIDGEDTKDWDMIRVESAGNPDNPYEFDFTKATILHTLKGVDNAVKDPVLIRDDGQLHMFYTCHPLDVPRDEADQMWTEWMTSNDNGLTWENRRKVMDTRGNGKWNGWGSRITAVLWDYENHKPIAAYYDGKNNSTENKYERCGIAYWEGDDKTGGFESKNDGPVTHNPISSIDEEGVVQRFGAFRYGSFVIDEESGVLHYYSEETMVNGKKGTFYQKLDLYKSSDPDPLEELAAA